MHGRTLAAMLAVLTTLALPAAASADTFPVTNGNDTGAGSLRDAIDQANANNNQADTRDDIVIDAAVTAIDVSNTALTVTEPVVISSDHPVTLTASGTAHDGLVFESGAGSATPSLQPFLVGLSMSGFTRGVVAQAQGLTVDGATVSGSTGSGIEITGADVFVVHSTISGSGGDGVLVNGAGAVMGSASGQPNVIGGNDGAGVHVDSGGTDANISSNRVGTDGAGTAADANATGVIVEASGALVFDNVLSGNTTAGVELAQCATLVDNDIGLGATGAAVPNGLGVLVSHAGCLVGGSNTGDGNRVSGNGGAGIRVTGDDVVVQGNLIGTEPGAADRGNGASGVVVDGASGALVGGPGDAGNTIAFNDIHGVELADASSATVDGNAIRDNGEAGVQLENAPDARVKGNTIRDNGGDGVQGTGTTTVEALGNSIVDNGDLGLNAGGGVPTISSVATGAGKLRVRGSFTAAGSGTYTLELFSNDACDPSGFGEGQTPLATVFAPATGAGTAAFSAEIDASVPVTKGITFTATRQRDGGLPGVTSDFSNCFEIPDDTTTAFATAAATVSETGGNANVKVIRSGDVSEPSTVDFATADLTAKAGQDYTATSGTLSFAAGESEKSILVPIINDAVAENPQAFTITLSNPSDGTLGAPATETVTITSNDEAGLVVTNPDDQDDDGTCDQDCTLGDAIVASNTDADPDRDAITFVEDLGLIALTGDLPAITRHVLIVGPATINGGGTHGGISVLPGAGGTNETDDTEIFDGVDIVDTDGPAIDVAGARVVVQDAVIDSPTGIRFHNGASGAVGGLPGHGNTITTSSEDGVTVDSGATVNVSHNTITAGAGGTGIHIASPGGPVFDNVVSGGSGAAGIVLDACPSALTANTVGGQGDGIQANAGCQIGGAGPGQGNTIAGNAGAGVLVTASGVTLFGNSIHDNGGAGVRSSSVLALLRGNSITANGGLGIDNGPAGVTGGAPLLTTVTREGGKLHVIGTLGVGTPGQYDLEFFSNTQCDPSGYGEGATPLGTKSLLAASPGDVPIDVVLDADAPAGSVVTATWTKDGQTSEFSACATVKEPSAAPPPGGTTPPPSGGTPQKADPQSAITFPRRRVKARRLKRIKGTAEDAARVDVAVIRIKRRRCFALTRTGDFKRRTGPGRCSPRRFFKATGTNTWSFKLKKRFRPGRYVIYSRATAADGTREAPPAARIVRVRR